MDFNTHLATPATLSAVAADALLLVLVGDAAPAGLDKTLAALLSTAVSEGDFAFKSGRTLYLHGASGVKARRVVFAAAANGSPKALNKAVGAGVARCVLKSIIRPSFKERGCYSIRLYAANWPAASVRRWSSS